MATLPNKEDIRQVRQRKYLARDFDSFLPMLLQYAQDYYPDRIKDFSEASLGGLLLDFAALVGDNLSFYLDHEYGELNPDTAVETQNIQALLRASGVEIVGAAPAVVPVTVYLEIPAEIINNSVTPMIRALPKVLAGTVFTAESGVDFILLEDLDFAKKNSDGIYIASIGNGRFDSSGNQLSFMMSLSGVCVSGAETTESFTVSDTFVPFRKYTLSNTDVSDIISVTDSLGNVYYRVSSLTEDVVYRNVLNTAGDYELVKDVIKVVPAPYRFIAEGELSTRKTVLTFGGGSANALEDDVIPDPSEFAIPFYYSKTFSRTAINPQQLISTKTLGVAATNTVVSVTYRHGGGLNHNADPDTIKNVKTLKIFFAGSPQPQIASKVRSSIEVSNLIRATGGADAPSEDDLKQLIPAARNSQERIVTRPDMLARVYRMPSNFGRVFRAAIRSNPNNPLVTLLYVVSKDADNNLQMCSDTLKQNIKNYLNPYRQIADAIEVLDVAVVNLQMQFDVLIDSSLNRNIVMQNIMTKLRPKLDIKNFNIDQPIIINDFVSVINAVNGVITVNQVSFKNATGIINDRVYSDQTFNVASYTRKGMLFPPPGGLFEFRYFDYDVVGRVAA